MSIDLSLANAAGQPIRRLSVDMGEHGGFRFVVANVDGGSRSQEVTAQALKSLRDLPMGWKVRLGDVEIHHRENEGVFNVDGEESFITWTSMRDELARLPLAKLI